MLRAAISAYPHWANDAAKAVGLDMGMDDAVREANDQIGSILR